MACHRLEADLVPQPRREYSSRGHCVKRAEVSDVNPPSRKKLIAVLSSVALQRKVTHCLGGYGVTRRARKPVFTERCFASLSMTALWERVAVISVTRY